MTDAIFLRLLASDDKGAELAAALAARRQGQDDARVFEVDPESFRQIPGAPFAYWVSERVRRLFRELPPFEGEGRTVKQGLATADDFRFVRAWWEVAPERILDAHHGPDWKADLPAFQAWCRGRTHEGKRWAPFAKGGEYSPYYADIHLVVNWEWEGKEIKDWICERYPYLNGNWEWVAKNTAFYFRPGLTWPLRARRFAPQPLSSGGIFSVRGYAMFAPPEDLPSLLGLGNSSSFDLLFKTMLGRFGFPEFIVGVLQKMPFPTTQAGSGAEWLALSEAARRAAESELVAASSSETARGFVIPRPVRSVAIDLDEDTAGLSLGDELGSIQLTELQRVVDDAGSALYNVSLVDFGPHADSPASAPDEPEDTEAETDEDEVPSVTDASSLASSLVSYLLGCVFGRWDVRVATGERHLPDLPDPFDPLPVCSPGMLQGEDGLPLRSTPEGYPLSIDWDGILVDDPGHPDDLMTRIRQVLEVVYEERAGAIEAELAEFLGVKDLRDYFRRPTKGGFWLDHVARYSKSRRKAPIYWLLQSKKRNYSLWLYYHRLDQDLLYKALVNYVEPKLRLEEARLKELEQTRLLVGAAGREAKQLAREAEAQEELLQELTEFAQALSRAADLHLHPDLDDGVLLNIAPLWELVPWKEAATTWQELLKGKYPWSSVGQQLNERGMVRG